MVTDVIPAIDLKGGGVVRLKQGMDDQTTMYPGDPVEVAQEWVRQGARRLHVVNLDGAFGRESGNTDVMRRICRDVNALVQYGGGIRSLREARLAFEGGCAKLVVGTIAIENPPVFREMVNEFGGERIIVALDTREGKVTTKGWTVTSEHDVVDIARDLYASGISEILHTNILHDGMMKGPDVDTLRMLGGTGLRIIASGGVSSHEDVHTLVALNLTNLSGIIVGKALYENKIRLELLLKELADGEEENNSLS